MEISGPSSTEEENRFFVLIQRRGKCTTGAGDGQHRQAFLLSDRGAGPAAAKEVALLCSVRKAPKNGVYGKRRGDARKPQGRAKF